MAGQAGKWRYGLLPLAALWLALNTIETDRIEADLAARARGALDALAVVGGAPKVDGRDVILAGEIADENSCAAALSGVGAAPGVRKVTDALSRERPSRAATAPESKTSESAERPAKTDQAKTEPATSPYLFRAESAGGKVALSGYYPDEETHARLLAAARGFAGREAIDKMQRGSGAPRDFAEAALAGLGQLARLREGALDLRDRVARLSGEAAGAGLADDIRAKLVGALPGDFTVVSQLTGPARAPAPAKPGEPPSSKAPDSAGAGRETVNPAAACQARMAALVRAHPIVFAPGSSRLAIQSADTLDAVAAEAKRCPGVDFEIAGHTDDIGFTSENLELSRRRAENVLVFLVAAGVAPQRLTAAGYGEKRPLVPNDSDENRAKNRRIEFNLRQGRLP